MPLAKTVVLFAGLIHVILGSVFSNNLNKLIIDLTEDCVNNYYTSIHLPYGTGSSDARIVLLRPVPSYTRNCTIDIIRPQFQKSCGDKCMTIVVVEFFNYKTYNTCTMNGGVFMVSGSQQFGDVCADLDSNPNQTKNELQHRMHAYVVRDRNFSIKIDFWDFFGTIKVTATSGKFLGTSGNCSSNEIVCILKGQVFCIHKLLECDGNCNCGTPKLYDEYCSNLHVQENILLMIIYGVCLVAVVMFFLIQILRVCVPSVADHFFVFHESDEYKFVLTSQSLPPLDLSNQNN